jgi:hypothetical protein
MEHASTWMSFRCIQKVFTVFNWKRYYLQAHPPPATINLSYYIIILIKQGKGPVRKTRILHNSKLLVPEIQ